MALIETKHTLSRLNKIKKDLTKARAIISYASMFIFFTYYLYLVSLNLHNLLYLIIYSSIILTIILFFVVETCIKEDKFLLKSEKRRATEQKRKLKKSTKILKFVAKTILVVVAIFETVNNFSFMLPNVINICSAVVLLVQILLELIIQYVIKEIDYFRLSVELDLDGSSGILKKLLGPFTEGRRIEEEIRLKQSENYYSDIELKMIDNIKKEADEYVFLKQNRIDKLKELLNTINKEAKTKHKVKIK